MLITDVCNLKCHLKTFIYFYTVNLFDTAISFDYFVFFCLFYAFMCLFCTTLSFACALFTFFFSLLNLKNVNSSVSSLRELIINKLALFEPPPYHTTRIYIIHDFTSF